MGERGRIIQDCHFPQMLDLRLDFLKPGDPKRRYFGGNRNNEDPIDTLFKQFYIDRNIRIAKINVDSNIFRYLLNIEIINFKKAEINWIAFLINGRPVRLSIARREMSRAIARPVVV